jgi:CheY-like chemotaxis protein
MGDSTQFHQGLMNLCTNSDYAMSDGGILSLLLEDVTLDGEFVKEHSGMAPGRFVKLAVSDTGCGISQSDMERIFDPFFTTKPQGEGTGMGLSVVHGIVKNMQGMITVRSEPGRGTEFVIYLPALEDVGVSAEIHSESDIPRGTGNVMVIDDESEIALIEKEMLESLGYRAMSFDDSRKALDAFTLEPEAFDIIVTDFTMPHLPGLDLVRKVRKIRSDIPVIICSGRFDLLSESMAHDMGIAQRLSKPITVNEMAHAVSAALKKVRFASGLKLHMTVWPWFLPEKTRSAPEGPVFVLDKKPHGVVLLRLPPGIGSFPGGRCLSHNETCFIRYWRPFLMKKHIPTDKDDSNRYHDYHHSLLIVGSVIFVYLSRSLETLARGAYNAGCQGYVGPHGGYF